MSAAIDFSKKTKTPFTAVPNDLFDQIIRIQISGHQHRVLNYIIRNTLGFHQESCSKDINRISEQTGINKPEVHRAIRVLTIRNIIILSSGQLSINPDFSQWKIKPEQIADSGKNTTDSGKNTTDSGKNTTDTIVNKKFFKTLRPGSDGCKIFLLDKFRQEKEVIKEKIRKISVAENEVSGPGDFESLFENTTDLDKAKFQASIAGKPVLVMQFKKKGFKSAVIQTAFIDFMAESESEPLPKEPEPEKTQTKESEPEKPDVKSDNAEPGIVGKINKLCKQISDMNQGEKRFNPWQFAQSSLNQNHHPGAVIETLESVLKHWESVRDPWGYAKKIIKVQSGNHCGRDFERKAAQAKQEFDRLISEKPELIREIMPEVKAVPGRLHKPITDDQKFQNRHDLQDQFMENARSESERLQSAGILHKLKDSKPTPSVRRSREEQLTEIGKYRQDL